MHEQPRQILCEIVTKHGRALLMRPDQCKALLLDGLEEAYKPEFNALIVTLQRGIVEDLLHPPFALSKDARFKWLTRKLRDNFPLDEQAALWAIESWDLALDASAHQAQPVPPVPRLVPALLYTLLKRLYATLQWCPTVLLRWGTLTVLCIVMLVVGLFVGWWMESVRLAAIQRSLTEDRERARQEQAHLQEEKQQLTKGRQGVEEERKRLEGNLHALRLPSGR